MAEQDPAVGDQRGDQRPAPVRHPGPVATADDGHLGGMKAADQGLALAQSALGEAYADGLGVPQDYGQAVAWYRKAADQGDADAQFNLGAMYAYGRGVPQNRDQAITWYRKAGDQGHPDAPDNLRHSMKLSVIAPSTAPAAAP